MQWVTAVGNFSTDRTVKMQFQLQEINPTATITYNIHVKKSLGLFNMIIDRDFLHKLGIGIDFSKKTVS